MTDMKKGIPASPGYAIGTAFLKKEAAIRIGEETAADIAAEQAKFKAAIETAGIQLAELREKARLEMGEAAAAILDSQLLFLDDPELTGAAARRIEMNQISAARAVRDIVAEYVAVFAGLEDEYLRERAADLRDIGARLLANLTGTGDDGFAGLPEQAIVVARDLTPSDTAQLDKAKVIALVTDGGGPTAHSAIMARTLEIPAVVGLGDITATIRSGDTLIVDGCAGAVLVNPDPPALAMYRGKKAGFEAEREQLKALAGAPAVTKAGKPIILAANIGKPEDAGQAIANGAEAIGLFRTEFLYMGRAGLPGEEEQYRAYRRVAEQMAGKPVVIRTLDIGGDKHLPYLPLPAEMNPFLGFRAIRLCLERKDIFRSQLRAILRASAHGKIQIMFPMIGAMAELRAAQEFLRQCMDELQAEGVPFDERIAVGMMIEIPAAALMADEFAGQVDFFSIGTNDLIQYTLAADRTNEKVSQLYDPMHPAVWRLIRTTIAAAHREGIWCGMCGELAGDPKAIPALLECGLDEFSMNPGAILAAKKIILNS
jgi:phosphotransferase system enzyme I (PtsI)